MYTIERVESLAAQARERFEHLGYSNVHVLCGDGSLGWPAHAPYDAIAVAAGGPKIPEPLLDQLAVGGRLVMPVGSDPSWQTLVRVTRENETEFRQQALEDVKFVPLIGEAGWREKPGLIRAPKRVPHASAVAKLVREVAEPIEAIESASVDALLERMGDARVVLLGESSHGTSEFYRMRATITRELIARRGFSFVAVEADWPDAGTCGRMRSPSATSSASLEPRVTARTSSSRSV